jgi:hypothetical protein
VYTGHVRSFLSKFGLNPRQLQAMHGFLTFLWTVMMPLSIWQGWIMSVAFISVVSIYANMVGHFSAWQAARSEVASEADS